MSTSIASIASQQSWSATARNIHLNPKRTDQALALTTGGWAAIDKY